jgi:two-component system chemotaxis sensor kinase CheA
VKDPYRYFRIEAREIADALSLGVLELEGEPHDRAPIVERLLRHAHTLKGAARVVGLSEIASLAHALEDALAAAGDGPADALLAHVDAISAKLDALSPAPGPAGADPPPREEEPWAAGLDLDAVDRLLDTLQDARRRLGALRRAAARAREIDGGIAAEIGGAAASLSADLDRIGEHAHALRLVPASAMFAQLERAARDAARELDKRVAFEAKGGEHHLDGRVLARVRDALLQVVKNAVDHGIEDEGERASAGKPLAGRILLEVTRAGHRVTFTCRDDGRGIDVEAVRRSAAARAAAPEGDAALLVFEAGVSTRSSVTALSGRGVGLDVAREIATQLHGEVAVASEPGRGAAFSITVPVSLSSLPVLGVRAGDLVAAIPLDAVRRTMRVAPGDVSVVGDREVTVALGSALPFLRLADWAGAAPEDAAAPRIAVVVAAPRGLAAIGVDRLLGAEHAILQPVPAIAGQTPALGASLDEAGVPRPVLDPAALVAAAAALRRVKVAERAPERRVLVIDDSLTTRMLEQSILESAGYHVDTASSGEEGLTMAHAAPYDVFIVDVEMPGMDGFSFVARTQEDPALRDVPAIVVSSRGARADQRRGAEAGARAYVVKEEFVEESFLELVRELAA